MHYKPDLPCTAQKAHHLQHVMQKTGEQKISSALRDNIFFRV
jgi:hypothetical protein